MTRETQQGFDATELASGFFNGKTVVSGSVMAIAESPPEMPLGMSRESRLWDVLWAAYRTVRTRGGVKQVRYSVYCPVRRNGTVVDEHEFVFSSQKMKGGERVNFIDVVDSEWCHMA